MISWEGLEGTTNGTAAWFLETFVAGKFYRLFALLFGVGFALQMQRLEARGAPFVTLYLRRLGVLFVIGSPMDCSCGLTTSLRSSHNWVSCCY